MQNSGVNSIVQILRHLIQALPYRRRLRLGPVGDEVQLLLLGDPTAEPAGPELHPPPHAIREIAHPDDALAVMAAYMPKLVDANVQVLRSSAEDLRLNGQTLLRTDPSVGGAPGEPSTIVHWHVDNAFLDEHMDSTPRTYE